MWHRAGLMNLPLPEDPGPLVVRYTKLAILVDAMAKELAAIKAELKVATQPSKMAWGSKATTIITAVSATTGVTVDQIVGKSRRRHAADARHIAVWLFRRTTRATTISVGEVFHMDHSNVSAACGKVDDLMGSDPEFRALVVASGAAAGIHIDEAPATPPAQQELAMLPSSPAPRPATGGHMTDREYWAQESQR